MPTMKHVFNYERTLVQVIFHCFLNRKTLPTHKPHRVKCQIQMAFLVYVTVEIIIKKLKSKLSLSQFSLVTSFLREQNILHIFQALGKTKQIHKLQQFSFITTTFSSKTIEWKHKNLHIFAKKATFLLKWLFFDAPLVKSFWKFD